MDLERYGRSMGISLYPKDVLKEVDTFLASHSEFYKTFQVIEEHTKKLLGKPGLNRGLLQELLELKEKWLSSYSQDALLNYRKACETLTKEHSDALEQMKNYLNQIREKRKTVFEQLESFIKTNNLSLKPY